jgi:hypothetical protein
MANFCLQNNVKKFGINMRDQFHNLRKVLNETQSKILMQNGTWYMYCTLISRTAIVIKNFSLPNDRYFSREK